ncbi:NAD(P)-binding protein [Pluteus cervinus]|uniref:NAD(P)-binding protein n=1 Tax=Pluteus cervinus TaxID=181527 RepID=A0ACD3BDX1_9AGAR|nr:NAD(P)-binding protein [Pluteus cervinus]
MTHPSRTPVVVVTGASRGIGLAVTKHLLEAYKAKVVTVSRTRSPELQALSSDSLLSIDCDVTDAAALTKAISLGVEKFHHLDGLVLNAGTLDPLGTIGNTTPVDEWKHHFDVNFFSLVTALKAALPDLRKSEFGGKVVFVSSGAAVKGVAGWGPYNASKAAMNSLARTLATEEPNIISVALRPGMVDTEMQNQLRQRGAEHMAEDVYKSFVATHSDGKLVNPNDSGRAIAALSTKAPKSLSGEFITWDSEQCKALL